MHLIKKNILRLLRAIYWKISSLSLQRDVKQTKQFEKFVELKDQDASDYIRNLLSSGKPCLISKFGGFELSALEQYKSLQQSSYSWKDFYEYISLKRNTLWWPKGIDGLCQNAGFFPNDFSLLEKYYDVNMDAIRQIDVLGSYLPMEKFFEDELLNAKKVNLEGFYAPFFFTKPWTSVLSEKKVLVVHPFDKDIEKQYARRSLIWDNKDVLPEFTLITYKSVQSMLGIKTPYKDWFAALEKMKQDIAQIDFDVALVGCGAYGMPLAAHIKKLGKQAVHLAGWTQVLFGILGKRWEEDTRMQKYINSYWIHPSSEFVPAEASKIENGCYW